VAFEIGNPDLEREATIGLDVSVRHSSSRVRGDVNFYVYDIDNFVFPALTGQEQEGLRVAEFRQGDSRFAGFDASGSFQLHNRVWLNVGLGYVNAKLTDLDQALPRIPPFKGRVRLDFPYAGFTVTPEWLWAARQDRVFIGETETAGSSVVNVKASHVWAQAHAAHILSVTAYNLTDELYRNHTSFIKDLAPEIGRGVKVTYAVRYF
jgi:iron complex outermembrane receptor protein